MVEDMEAAWKMVGRWTQERMEAAERSGAAQAARGEDEAAGGALDMTLPPSPASDNLEKMDEAT